MTLAEYKRQAQEIAEILMNFSGKEEEAEKFAKNLLEKYREFGEINAKALECKNLAEFKDLADANGMKFESDEEANELFLGLSKGKKEVEKAILSTEEMYAVSGGWIPNERSRRQKLTINNHQQAAPQVQAQQGHPPGILHGILGIGVGVLGILADVVGLIYTHALDDFETGRAFILTGSTVGVAGCVGGLIGVYGKRYGWF